MSLYSEMSITEKNKIERQFAENFKREMGFTGKVKYSHDIGRLYSLNGNFEQFPAPTKGDTTAYRLLAESMFIYLSDYINVPRSELQIVKNVDRGRFHRFLI
jgi:hypothetical protein